MLFRGALSLDGLLFLLRCFLVFSFFLLRVCGQAVDDGSHRTEDIEVNNSVYFIIDYGLYLKHSVRFHPQGTVEATCTT